MINFGGKGKKKWQRVTAGIICGIIAAAMILSLLITSF